MDLFIAALNSPVFAPQHMSAMALYLPSQVAQPSPSSSNPVHYRFPTWNGRSHRKASGLLRRSSCSTTEIGWKYSTICGHIQIDILVNCHGENVWTFNKWVCLPIPLLPNFYMNFSNVNILYFASSKDFNCIIDYAT